MTMNIILGICLLISIILNVSVAWYLYKVVPKVIFVSRNIQDLTELIVNYRSHLKAVYGLETFYGDETLQGLLDHTKSLSILLEEYESIANMTTIEEEENYEEENEIEDTEQEKDVFYAGSRKRDS